MKVNRERFEQAPAIEEAHSLAVCDTDPLKLRRTTRAEVAEIEFTASA